MTRAATLIRTLQALGVLLSVDGMRLVIDSPYGVITNELRKQLLQLKPAILTELKATAAQPIPVPAIPDVARLFAAAYLRYEAQGQGRGGGSGDDRLANVPNKSLHGGDS